MVSKYSLKKSFPFFLWVFFCVSFFLFFRNPVSIFLNRILVKPLISEFDNTIFSGLVLMVLCVGIYIWLVVYGSKKFLQTIGMLTLTFYLFMMNTGYWHFLPFMPFPLLANWDIVVIALCLPALISLWPKKVAVTRQDFSQGFIEDIAIEKEGQDSFKRSIVAAEIASKISKTINEKSFAIGILGEYGSGKTSFLNLIKAQLTDKNVEVIDFNPWSSEGTDNIHQDFFDLLSAKLYELDPKISGLLLDYSRKLSRIDSSTEKTIRKLGFASNWLQKNNYHDDFEQIDESIRTCGKKIIITIDDLDRLYNDEVLEVLRLIRNTGNFSNIVYIVAYERSYVESAIRSLNTDIDRSFLDKIIQLEIPLPKREVDDLLNILETHLSTMVSPKHMETYRSHIVDSGFKTRFDFSFEKVFRQSRDVIKFVNNLKINYTLIGQEVAFESLFVLELLKFRFPLIYDRLFEHKEDFVNEHLGRSDFNRYYELKTYSENKNELLVISKTLRDEGKYNEQEIKLISGLLKNLFFRFDRSERDKHTIIYPMFFERYFRYRLSNSEISEREFKAAYGLGIDSIKQYIDQQAKKNMLPNVSTRIFQEKPATKEEYELQVESLFYLGPKLKEQSERKYVNREAFTDLIWNYGSNLTKKYYAGDEEAFRKFISSIFEAAPHPYLFHSEVLHHVTEGGLKEISLSEEDIVKYRSYYFTELVKKEGLSRRAIWIFWWTKSKTFIPLPNDPNRGHINMHFYPKITALLKEYLKNYDPHEFLKMSIQDDMREAKVGRLYKEMLGIFEQAEDLKKMVETNSMLDKDVKKEYLDFFERCKEKGFQSDVPTMFKTTLKSSKGDYADL